jgi:uncharacterized integral membrane protein
MEMQTQERETTTDVAPATPDGNETSTGAPPAAESSGERFRRKARRTRFHLYAFATVALLVCLVALVVANTRQVKLSWVVGSSTASLVWIVLFSAILGWLLGVMTSALFRWRTRERRL